MTHPSLIKFRIRLYRTKGLRLGIPYPQAIDPDALLSRGWQEFQASHATESQHQTASTIKSEGSTYHPQDAANQKESNNYAAF